MSLLASAVASTSPPLLSTTPVLQLPEAFRNIRPAHLAAVRAWVDGPQDRPLLVDAKVMSFPAWWLEEVFRGH